MRLMRRCGVRVASVVLWGCALSCSSKSSTPAAPNEADAGNDDAAVVVPKPTPVPVAPTFIGSGGFGYAAANVFVGAAAPNGMAKVGPDTSGPWGTINFLHYTGYWFGDDTIQGFSHMHLHGTGACDYGVLTVMPTDAAASPTSIKPAGYQSKFQKSSETGAPGYYAVTLDRGNIKVEITATPHAAHHRWTYPAGATSAHVVVDLEHHLSSGSVKDAEIALDVATQRIHGRLHSVGQMSNGFGGYDVWFEARTRQPWTTSQVWSAGAPPAVGTSAKGSGVGASLDFDLGSAKGPIELQVGISLVSAEGASANLAAELPAFAFDATRKATADAWNGLFSRLKVTGGSEEHRTMLTAALYHAFLMPTVLSDVDGKYVGVDGKVATATGYQYMSDISMWDSYRTLHPLWSLLARDKTRDAVRSIAAMGEARGSYPRWPIATGEAGTMIGDSAEVIVADAYLKGMTDFDVAATYERMRALALDPAAPAGGRGARDDVEVLMKTGYVPASKGASVSRTIEQAQDDFALAQLAEALGHHDDATKLLARAQGWRKLFDPATGFLWAKNADGSWASDHGDETAFTSDFDEANAGQSLWGAPHDFEGLVTLLGSRAKVVSKLSSFFEQGKVAWDALDPANTLLSAAPRPYFWAGNEPDIHSVYLFAMAGHPELTQRWLRWTIDNFYGPGADGLPGNDDGGTMSSWLIFGSLGFYPIYGSDRYVIGAPLFPHAELALPGGTFTIDAPAVSDANLYVQSVKLDGTPVMTPQLRQADLHAGGKLEFVMGPSPSAWGAVKE